MVDLCFPRNECYLLKAISISSRVYSPFQTVNFSCSISMRTNQNYINVRGKPNQLFLALNNFLTTPPPSCLSPIIHLFHSSSIFYFNLLPRVLSYPPLRSERERETLVGSGHERPRAKLILREEFFVSQFFVCFLFVTILLIEASVFTIRNDYKSKLDLLTLQL